MVGQHKNTELEEQNAELHARLLEAEETLRAISAGEVDAFVVSSVSGPQVFTLQSADHPYRLLVEEMLEGAVTISADGVILYCNRRFAETVGYPSDQLISQHIDQYIVHDQRESFLTFRQAALAARGGEREFNLRQQSAQDVPVLISANLLPLDESNIICLIITDSRFYFICQPCSDHWSSNGEHRIIDRRIVLSKHYCFVYFFACFPWHSYNKHTYQL